MKRLLSIILVVCFMFSFTSFLVTAKNDGVISAPKLSAKAGDEITIPITYKNNPGVYVLRVTVNFEPSAFEYAGTVKSGEDHFNYTINDKDRKNGKIIVLMDSKEVADVKGDITLFKIKLKVKNKAENGNVPIRVICEKGMATNVSLAAVEPKTSNGSVIILCKNHEFDTPINDGSVQCSECGIIKNTQGNLSVGINTNDTNSDIVTSSDSALQTGSEESATKPTENDQELKGIEKTDDSTLYIIIAISAFLILGLCVLIVVYNKNKKQ